MEEIKIIFGIITNAKFGNLEVLSLSEDGNSLAVSRPYVADDILIYRGSDDQYQEVSAADFMKVFI